MFDSIKPTRAAENELPSLTEHRLRACWHFLRDSLRGVPLDLTTAPIGKSLLMLAIPMIVEMLMESVFTLVDIFWVGRLGASAVATVGLTDAMMMMIIAIAMGVSLGVMALVARRVGEKDLGAAARTATQGIVVALVLALGLGVAGAVFAPDLLRLMGADADVVATGSGFTRVMLGGNATVFLLFLINAIFRGAGDAAHAMRVLLLGNALNIVLGPCFIFGVGPFPELGVTGAAVATTTGRGIAVLYQIYLLTSGRSKLRIVREHLGIDFRLMGSVLRLSSLATLGSLIHMGSYVAIMRILSVFGSAPLAGYTIASRILMLAILPVFGVSAATATMVGQNLGAGHPERAERVILRACLLGGAVFAVAGPLLLIGPHWLLGLFTEDADAIAHGATYLRVVSAGFLFYAVGVVLCQALNGAGAPRTTALINLFVLWGVQIPLAWALSRHTTFGANGVFIALTVRFPMLAAVSFAVFRHGGWKRTKV